MTLFRVVRILRNLFIWPYSEPVMQCMLDLYVVVLSIVLWPWYLYLGFRSLDLPLSRTGGGPGGWGVRQIAFFHMLSLHSFVLLWWIWLFWRVALHCVQIYTLLTNDHLYNRKDLIVLSKLCVIQSYFTLGLCESTLYSLIVFYSSVDASRSCQSYLRTSKNDQNS